MVRITRQLTSRIPHVLMLVRHSIVKYPSELMWLQQVLVALDQVIRVEALVVHANLLHLLFIEVESYVFLPIEDLVADGAAGYLVEPAIDALLMVDVEAAEHAARALVGDGLEANDAVVDEILPILHPNEGDFYLGVGLCHEPVVDSVSGASYESTTLGRSASIVPSASALRRGLLAIQASTVASNQCLSSLIILLILSGLHSPALLLHLEVPEVLPQGNPGTIAQQEKASSEEDYRNDLGNLEPSVTTEALFGRLGIISFISS